MTHRSTRTTCKGNWWVMLWRFVPLDSPRICSLLQGIHLQGCTMKPVTVQVLASLIFVGAKGWLHTVSLRSVWNSCVLHQLAQKCKMQTLFFAVFAEARGRTSKTGQRASRLSSSGWTCIPPRKLSIEEKKRGWVAHVQPSLHLGMTCLWTTSLAWEPGLVRGTRHLFDAHARRNFGTLGLDHPEPHVCEPH